jgi:hypothetical protein
MVTSAEASAFKLTAPAFLSFVGYGMAEWCRLLRAWESGYDLFWLSFWCGLVGIITSLSCLFSIKITSYRIIVCQIFNFLWLGFIFYSLFTLGPIGMQK